MLPACLALCFWVPALLGFGSFARVEGGPIRRAGIAGVAGLAALATLAVVLNLFVPLSSTVAAAAGGVGWILFIRARRMFLSNVRPRHAVFAAGLLLTLAALTQLPARHYDAGLYFLQTVRWAQEHAQVAGLASLHPRLGYNSSWFVLAAIMEAPGLVGRSSFFLNAFPTLFAAFIAADAIGRLRSGERTTSTYYFALATFAAAYGVDTLASLYPDEPVAILTFLSLGLWVRALEEPREFGSSALLGALLAAFAFTVKVSCVVLLVAWAAFLLARRRSFDRRLRLAAFAGAAAILVPWTVRGLLTSGCVLFPAVWSCVPTLPWSTPAAMVTRENAMIRGWARWPGLRVEDIPPGWGWLGPWAQAAFKLRHVSIPTIGAVLGIIFGRGRLLRQAAIREPLIVVLAGLAFWFFTAPSPRFGLAYLLPGAMLPLSVWAADDGPTLRPWIRQAALAATIAAAVMFLQWSLRPLLKLRTDTVALARWPEFPTPVVSRRVTWPGTEVNVPVGGDQCWAAELPCTPWCARGLEWTGAAFIVDPTTRDDARGNPTSPPDDSCSSWLHSSRAAR